MPRTRSTIVKFHLQNDMETSDDGKSNSGGDASNFLPKEETLSKILQIAHDISVTSNNSEEKSLLLSQLKRLLDGDVVQAVCEPHQKSIGCHHSLKESINSHFMKGGERLLHLLQALGQLVENYSGKNNVQDTLHLLSILKAISCTDFGSELISQHHQIMVWIFDKFCMQDFLENNNREDEMVDLILSTLQRCTRKYQVQIYDGWLKKAVSILKDLLLNEQEFQSCQSLVLLDILLNICNANKGRLPLIEQNDLKTILKRISEIKGAQLAENRLMTSRLQLLLVPYGLIVEDVDLAPLGINQVIKIMQNTVVNNHSPALMARCIDFLCDVLRFSPTSSKQHEPYWLLLAEEFQNMSESDKDTWFNSLASPLLELMSTIQGEDVQLVISESAAAVFNKWAAELCSTILVSIIRMQKDNMVAYAAKSKAFLVLSKSLVSDEIYHTLNIEIKQEIFGNAVKDIARALGGELNQLSNQEYIINSAKLVIAMGKFEDEFNSSLSSILSDTSMLELKSDSTLLASVLLGAHMASYFPRLWKEKFQMFLEHNKVCKHLASVLRDTHFDVANEVYFCIIPLLTVKGKLCLQKYSKCVDAFGNEQYSVFQVGNCSFTKSDTTLTKSSSNSKQEVVAEYEMKLKSLETEMDLFNKSLAANQELLHFSVSKNQQLLDERTSLMGRNLEELARNNDLMKELRRKEAKLEKLEKYVIEVKRVTDNLRVDSGLKGQRVAQVEQELQECRQRFENLVEENSELKKNITSQEAKIVKFRQLSHDNKQEMGKQGELLQRKEQALKTLREEHQELLEERDELKRFKDNILQVTTKARVK